ADFKVSRGSRDKTIVEFKLAKNSQLERNLEKQTQIYRKASDARRAVHVIIFFSREESTGLCGFCVGSSWRRVRMSCSSTRARTINLRRPRPDRAIEG